MARILLIAEYDSGGTNTNTILVNTGTVKCLTILKTYKYTLVESIELVDEVTELDRYVFVVRGRVEISILKRRHFTLTQLSFVNNASTHRKSTSEPHETPNTLWRPSFEVKGGITLVGYETSVDGDQVRDVQGNALPGSLKLQLRDLGPQADLDRLYPGAELDRTVEITYEDIVGYIREAESEQETVRDIPAPLTNMRKRPRSESSVDGLDSEDERKYKRTEKKTDEDSFAKDDEYRI
ncbi:hypothetical protein VE00_10604 [Pseudogymnoascus sp. WSF 3629]|nr:hypothetical protein VE00_10604 [Pseudogymnoascus sp. WSF 3629]